MTGPEPYPDDFDLNRALSRVESGAVDIVVTARNASNADAEQKEVFVRRLEEQVKRLNHRLDTVKDEMEDGE